MPAPLNPLKQALQAGGVQIGFWLNFASPLIAEMSGGAGYDWCLIDAEHGPNTLATIQAQLIALAGRPAAPVVRVPVGEAWVLKQVLDAGAQSVMVPMVETAEQAAALARAVRYPPDGIRGMGSAVSRVSDYDGHGDFVETANEQVFLIVQAETPAAVDNIDDIAAVPGVDAVFIGPSDLAARMGLIGQTRHPQVLAAIDHMLARIVAAGKVPGILIFDPAHWADLPGKGARMIAVAGDVVLFSAAARARAAEARRIMGG